MSQLVLPTRFTAIDGISGPARVMGKSLHDMVNSANVGLAKQERLWRKMMPSASGAAKNLFNYATAGAGFAAIGATTKGITDYETSIQSLQAVTGVSDSEMVNFKKEISATANESKKFAADVAGSFETVGSMMSQYLSDPKALNQITNAGIVLSKASRQDLVPALEQLTSIMNQFDIQANKSTETVNRLTAGEIVGSLRTSQVTEALQEFGAGAYAANVNLSESVALVEALAKQMKTEKIGVGARNILTVMDSAKGLDKKARTDLKKAGIDLSVLMDKTKSLSIRLHELSKISGDATAITSVFGRENKTAAQVIFNQLETYDKYLAKIQTTNEAQKQAEINSNTLMNRVKELGNTWLNYIATSDKTATGLNKVKDAIVYVTNNMDKIVSVGMDVIKVFALWKGAMIAQRVVTTALSIHLGFQSAMVGFSSLAMKENIVALTAQKVAMGVLAVQTTITTGDFAALNAVMLANPIGLVIAGVALLAGGIYVLTQKEKALREEYQKQIELNTTAEINKQTDALKKQIAQLVLMGEKLDEATVKQIKFNKSNLDLQRFKAETQLKQTKSELEKEKNKLYLGDLITGAFGEGHAMYGKRAELADKLLSDELAAKKIATEQLAVTQFAQQQVQSGNISVKDLGGIFNKPKSIQPEWTNKINSGSDWGKVLNPEKPKNEYFEKTPTGEIDWNKIYDKITGGRKESPEQKITIEAKNLPDWLKVSSGSSSTNSLTPSVSNAY